MAVDVKPQIQASFGRRRDSLTTLPMTQHA